MTERQEFHPKVMIRAWDRADGHCEGCGAKLFPGNIEYDHQIPCALGGDNSLENCIVRCRACHKAKTFKQDIPNIARAKRRQRKHIGIKKRSTFACSRDKPHKKKITGEVVLR